MSKFINPAQVVAQAGPSNGQVVADLGCGSGFYVLPAAQLVGSGGKVYAVDVVEDKLAATVSIARQMGYRNVTVVRADLTRPLVDIPADSCDMVILGNILHQVSNQEAVIANAYRILKTGGKLLVVEWKKELSTFGPHMGNRIEQQQLEIYLMKAGFRKVKQIEADTYHYAILLQK